MRLSNTIGHASSFEWPFAAGQAPRPHADAIGQDPIYQSFLSWTALSEYHTWEALIGTISPLATRDLTVAQQACYPRFRARYAAAVAR